VGLGFLLFHTYFGLAHTVQPRNGSGSGLERISADFEYVGCGFGLDFHPRVRGFGYPQRRGFGVDSTFRLRISVGAPKN
jgi:hypothetical protein